MDFPEQQLIKYILESSTNHENLNLLLLLPDDLMYHFTPVEII